MKIAFNIDFDKDKPNYVARAEETSRILKRITDEVNSGYTKGMIYDKKGNQIGAWSF